MNIFIL